MDKQSYLLSLNEALREVYWMRHSEWIMSIWDDIHSLGT